MSVAQTLVRPGPAGTAWLAERVSAAQHEDRLAPVTVVVPSQYAGLALRRELGRTGSINVRFAIIGKLAEMLGAGRLAANGRLPLTAPTRAAVMREAVRRAAPALEGAIDHVSLVDRLSGLARALRRQELNASELGSRGATAEAALAACREYRTLLAEHRLYDEVDLLKAAAEVVGDGSATAILRDVGTVVVFLAVQPDPPEATFLQALATRVPVEIALPDLSDDLLEARATRQAMQVGAAPGPARGRTRMPEIEVMLASDPTQEVCASVRGVLADLAADPPVRLHDTAILYRDSEVYGPLLRDGLRTAQLPYAALDGRPLSECIVGRGLLNLMRLRDQDFSRVAVLAWLSGLPHHRGHRLSATLWDSISREAGVIRGAGEWQRRLASLAAELRNRASSRELREDASPASIDYLGRRADQAEAIAAHIAEIGALTTPPPTTTWGGLITWAHTLRSAYVPTERTWPADEQEAGQLVDEIIDSLNVAGSIEPLATVRGFIVALEDALRNRTRPEGRLGAGVVIGPIASAFAMSFERVHILGVTERAYPSAPAADPFFGGEDPLGRREQHLADQRRTYLGALAAADGGWVLLSAPTHDADGRPAYPSPWLVDAVVALTGASVTPTGLRERPPAHPRIHSVRSAETAVRDAPVPLSLPERRLRQVMSWWRAGGRVAQAPLAARPEIGFAHVLEVLRRRRSSDLTEFDGNLAASASSEMLEAGLARTGLSATAIEMWATCPFSYLLGRLLRIEPTKRPEDDEGMSISALDQGSLVHAVLQRFFSALEESGRLTHGAAYMTADRSLIERIAGDEFLAAEARGVTGNALLWANEQAAIVRDLHSFLREDQRRREGGLLPRFFEQGFGWADTEGWPAPVLTLSDGREVKLHGYIDRIDMDATGSRAVVIDYKTGKADPDAIGVADRLRAGTKVQLAVYAAALRQWADRTGTPTRQIESLYWYVSAKGGFKELRLDYTPDVATTLDQVVTLIDDGIQRGAFPQVPGDVNEWYGGWDNCNWCAFDRICPSGRDAVWERKSAHPASRLHSRLRVAAEGTM